jgi:hypothetical protein
VEGLIPFNQVFGFIGGTGQISKALTSFFRGLGRGRGGSPSRPSRGGLPARNRPTRRFGPTYAIVSSGKRAAGRARASAPSP